jgi:hypothetical protein
MGIEREMRERGNELSLFWEEGERRLLEWLEGNRWS